MCLESPQRETFLINHQLLQLQMSSGPLDNTELL